MSAAPQARICTWVDLSLTDVERLLRASEATETLQQALGEILGLRDPAACSKQEVIELDLYTYAILFARKQNFSADQVSAFFTILKCVHCMCISTPFDNFQETFQYFQELLLRHGVNRPPYSTCLFSIPQVKAVSEYVLKTYFKHFKLYKYAFTKRVHLDLKLSYPGVPDSPELSETEPTGESEGGPTGTEDKLEGEREKDKEEEAEGSPVGGGVEGEEQSLSPEQQHLKQLIASTLADKMKELQVAVEKELGDQDKKLSERIGALEATVMGKSKNKKGK